MCGMRMTMCDSCQALTINGVLCHETGCPDAWTDTTRKCKWCGAQFKPDNGNQDFCDASCYRAYYNIPEDVAEDDLAYLED